MDNLSLPELEKLKEDVTSSIKSASGDTKQELIIKARHISEKIKSLTPKNLEKVAQTQQIQRDWLEVECEECGESYKSSNKTRVPVVYCKTCRGVRQNDLIEIIHPDCMMKFSINQQSDAETMLDTYCKADIRLDLHKTLDTISCNTKLTSNSVCCVSYVGALTVTRSEARQDILSRVASGQIRFGVLVFKRGSHRDPEAANNFTEPGSKAWFNKILNADDDANKLFVDDSDDHVNSVGSIGVKSILITRNDRLLDIINKHLT